MAEVEKMCPQCAERVKAAAKICRFCNFQFPEVTPSPGFFHRVGRLTGRVWADKWGRRITIFFAVVWIGGLLLPDHGTSSARPVTVAKLPNPVASETAPVAQLPVSAPEPEVGIEEARALSREAIANIQKRFETNRTKLKGFFANSAAVARSQEDSSALEVILAKFQDSKEKVDSQIVAKAKTLAVSVNQQTRELYASSMEEAFIKDGMDAKVRVSGAAKDRLTITYALMSQPLVYKFQNELHIGQRAREMGFKTLILDNGFESSLGKYWTIDL